MLDMGFKRDIDKIMSLIPKDIKLYYSQQPFLKKLNFCQEHLTHLQ